MKKGDAEVSGLADFSLFSSTNFIKLSKLLTGIFCYLMYHAFNYMFCVFA